MDLKLTEHVRNPISLLYKQKTGWKSDIWNFCSEKTINFGLYFAENRHFQIGHTLLRHCDVIRWLIFTILVSMERKDPTLYYCTKQLYFGHVNLKFTGGGNHPLRMTCYKKRLRKTRVKILPLIEPIRGIEFNTEKNLWGEFFVRTDYYPKNVMQ